MSQTASPQKTANRFLRDLTRSARSGRGRFKPPAYWFEDEEDFAAIWFPSAGCAWDLTGHCFSCNYGHPIRPRARQMVEAVALGLSALRRLPPTLWVSSFNFLDSREVPPDVRRQILELVAATDCEMLYSETHPSTVTRNLAADCVAALGGKRFVIEMGVETTNDFVRKWAFGKDFDNMAIRRAVAEAKAGGAECSFNIMVGMPLLSEPEAVTDATMSVQQAFEMGADTVVLFPCRIKDHSLLAEFHRQAHAYPTSLLALCAVIARIDESLWPRINLSWVRPKPHPGSTVGIDPPIPHSNPAAVKEALARFSKHSDGHGILALFEDCVYDRWLGSADLGAPLPNRMLKAFGEVAQKLLGENYWNGARHAVETELWNDWNRAPAGHLSLQ